MALSLPPKRRRLRSFGVHRGGSAELLLPWPRLSWLRSAWALSGAVSYLSGPCLQLPRLRARGGTKISCLRNLARGAGSSGEASPVLAATSQTVRAPDDADRGQQWIRIPVTQHSSSEPLSSEPLWTVPAANADAVPSELRDVLERAGCQVRCFRQLLPGSMEDGRRVVVPVDQVEVRYVGRQGFQ